jgi:hypothetical protein
VSFNTSGAEIVVTVALILVISVGITGGADRRPTAGALFGAGNSGVLVVVALSRRGLRVVEVRATALSLVVDRSVRIEVYAGVVVRRLPSRIAIAFAVSIASDVVFG